MKSECSIKIFFIEFVCIAHVILFVYAAVSKIIEFESFEVQLGKSPLLSAFAFWIARFVPATELLIAALLLLPRLKKTGLYMALNLMVMFSVYIFIILHYSSFIPCSCGGVLEKMSWNTHLVFNIIFILLALIAILVLEQNTYKKNILKIIIPVLSSTAIVVILYLQSERIMHYENPFTRRYPNHPAVFKNSYDLKYNSYYFAGNSGNKLYLGNYSTPLYLSEFDAELKSSKKIKIVFNPKKNVLFNTVKILVCDSLFYLSDGSIAKLYKGKTIDWEITKEYKKMSYFTTYAPMNSGGIFLRSNDPKTLDNILGIYTQSDSKIKYYRELLQKQIDGIFDTDGVLLYSRKMNKGIYLYYYRNEFFIINPDGNLESRNHTIDTISKVNLKVAYTKNGSVREISSPAQAVNAHAAINGNLLFVNSQVKGKYENDELWKKSFIIDVYDLEKKTYLMSFPVYKTKSDKLIYLHVSANYLYAIIGTDLVVYELQPILIKEL